MLATATLCNLKHILHVLLINKSPVKQITMTDDHHPEISYFDKECRANPSEICFKLKSTREILQ